MKFQPQKSGAATNGKSACVDCIDVGAVAVADSPKGIPMRERADSNVIAGRVDSSAARIREQLNGIATLRSAAINAALNVKGSFGEGFEAFMSDLLKRKPELALGFLKPMMMMGLEGQGQQGPERAPILIIQSGATVQMNTANVVQGVAGGEAA